MEGEVERGKSVEYKRSDTSGHSTVWNIAGRPFQRSAAVFICQVIILYISIITCFINLTVNNGPSELWISLLSLSLGSLLPSPKVKHTSRNPQHMDIEDMHTRTPSIA